MTEQIIQFGEDPNDKRVITPVKLPPEPEMPAPPLVDDEFQVPTRAEVAASEKLSPTDVQAAVQLRLFGAGYPEIAQTLGYVSATSVRLAVVKAIADTHDHEGDYKALRGMMSMRYEALLKSLAGNAFLPTVEKVVDGKKQMVPNDLHLPYLREARAVVKEMATLHGLNAPQVHAFINPDSEAFEAVVSSVAQRFIEEHSSPEGDIFELEPEDRGESDV